MKNSRNEDRFVDKVLIQIMIHQRKIFILTGRAIIKNEKKAEKKKWEKREKMRMQTANKSDFRFTFRVSLAMM